MPILEYKSTWINVKVETHERQPRVLKLPTQVQEKFLTPLEEYREKVAKIRKNK